jgi:hypothetical protein
MKNLRVPVVRRRLSLELVDNGPLGACGHIGIHNFVAIGRDEEDKSTSCLVRKSVALDCLELVGALNLIAISADSKNKSVVPLITRTSVPLDCLELFDGLGLIAIGSDKEDKSTGCLVRKSVALDCLEFVGALGLIAIGRDKEEQNIFPLIARKSVALD